MRWRGMDGHCDILIIGGGMAGLSAATALAAVGQRIIVLDKGRGPGGRMAARRAEIGGEQVGFDHGAQYFTARDPRFQAEVARWLDENGFGGSMVWRLAARPTGRSSRLCRGGSSPSM